MDGIAPVVDNLGHSGGDTAGDGVAGRTVGILGTKRVIVLALIPGGGQ